MDRRISYRNLPQLFLKAREELLGHFRPIINHFGLTEQQWRILRTLSEHEQLEPREICEICHILSPSLAGVLARFGLSGFTAAQTALPLVVVMLLGYLLGKRLWPRYAVPGTLLVAIVFVAITSGFTGAGIVFGLTLPVFVAPSFSFAAFVSLALPLFIVTMASQNLPGVAAIRASGYTMPISRPSSLTAGMTSAPDPVRKHSSATQTS